MFPSMTNVPRISAATCVATLRSAPRCALSIAVVVATGLARPQAVTITTGADAKVTIDNNNVPGPMPTPGFDSLNLPQNETSVAVSPVDPDIVAVFTNDYRIAFSQANFCQIKWLGLNVSADGGATWHNTMVPGFNLDTTPEGLASPAQGRSADPIVRFDAAGNLYLMGLSHACNPVGLPDPMTLPDASRIFCMRYDYTPGTPGGVSTPNSAGNPPNFTYAFASIVADGPVASAVIPGKQGTAGLHLDKPWMAIDAEPSSPGFGNIYSVFLRFPGFGWGPGALFCRSVDGGATFSFPKAISLGGPSTQGDQQGPWITVARNGVIYVSLINQALHGGVTHLRLVRSEDAGQTFTFPVEAAAFQVLPWEGPPGVNFRTPTFADVAVDDTDPDVVYLVYSALAGSPQNADVFVLRSLDRGETWGPPVRINDDATAKHQFFPTIDVANGALHVAWYDFRDSSTPGDPAATNDVLHVYYGCSNIGAIAYPAFSMNVRVTDVGQPANCLMGGDGIGDYIEISSRFDAAMGRHVSHLAWCDTRDVPPNWCLTAPPGNPCEDGGGACNANIYADVITVFVTP